MAAGSSEEALASFQDFMMDGVFTANDDAYNQPEEDSDQPEDESDQPEGESDQPEGESDQPEGEGDQPEGEGDRPEGETDKPEGEGDQPEGEGDQPEGERDKPEGESDQPEGEGDQPEGERDKPEAESDQPEGEGDQPEGEGDKPEAESDQPEGESDKPEGEGDQPEGEEAAAETKETDVVQEGDEKPAETEGAVPEDLHELLLPAEVFGEEIEEEEHLKPRVITSEEHAENIVAMEKVLDDVLDMAAEGKLPTKVEKKIEFEMKTKMDSTEDLLADKKDEAEEVVVESVKRVLRYQDEDVIKEEGSEEQVAEVAEEEEEGEEEQEDSASVQEAWAKRKQLLAEFDAVHDEGQRLRIMNMLLHSRVLRLMHRRPKKKSAFGSSASTLSRGSPSPSPSPSQTPDIADITAMSEALEKELMEAGEVRRQLDAEIHRGGGEDELRQRLVAARRGVAERAEMHGHLQQKVRAKLHAPPVRRQEAEKMLNRMWPQLMRLRKERLMHLRAKHALETAQHQVAKLEVFGPQRTVAAYEQLEADGKKLAERVQERTDQLAALRNVADRDLQQAAHLREALQGAHQEFKDARRTDLRTTHFLKMARQDVLRAKKKRDTLYKENAKLTREMDLLAYPDLLSDHEEVLWRLRNAQAELAQLRGAYTSQEEKIATARRLLKRREQSLKEGVHAPPPPDTSFLVMHLDARCGPSLFEVKHAG